MQTRIEHDTMGEVEVPSEALWGAQTQRSLQNFKIGSERLPRPIIRAMGLVKKAAAQTNAELNQIPSVHDKFHRTLILSGFCLLKIAKISLNSSFFPKPIKR